MKRAFCITEVSRESSLLSTREPEELFHFSVFSFPRQLDFKTSPKDLSQRSQTCFPSNLCGVLFPCRWLSEHLCGYAFLPPPQQAILIAPGPAPWKTATSTINFSIIILGELRSCWGSSLIKAPVALRMPGFTEHGTIEEEIKVKSCP